MIMRTIAITDQRGRMTGLVRFEEEQAEGAPEARVEPLKGQEVHEIKLPPELENMESVLDLYERITKEYTLDRDSARLTRKVPRVTRGRPRRSG
jgi:hypothetical protein